jgi:predicted phage terminase large subunit-like protein
MKNLDDLSVLANSILTDSQFRTTLAKESHYWFFNIYLAHYVSFETADFQKEMFALSEDEHYQRIAICAFRGSGKSTIMNLSYPIWSIIGKPQKKYVLLLGQTQAQARQHLQNLKRELENNALLKADLGPFEEVKDEWGAMSLVIPKYNARISAVSTDQSIRGTRHDEHRPDLIICDDVEDLNSVKTKEGRDKTYTWFTGEIIPAGDLNTKLIIVGNLLHEDSLLMRLRKQIEDLRFDAVFKFYPLLDENGQSNWPGKFKTEDDIIKLKLLNGNEIAWHREYLLEIIPDQDRVVHPDWIQYYDTLPTDRHFMYVSMGIDLAISQKDSADYTAIVTAKIYGRGRDMKIYVLPNPLNQRITFPETLIATKEIYWGFRNSGYAVKLWYENVQYQEALGQDLRLDNIKAEPFNPKGQDKRARLAMTTPMIQSGRVLFPKNGVDLLVTQITCFGVEKHDDLADAFSTIVLKAMEDNQRKMPLVLERPDRI